MTTKLAVSIICSLLVVLVGCGRKNIKYGYIIFQNDKVVASAKILTPNQITDDEKWKLLDGLELEAAYVNREGFQFKSDENATGVMTLRGNVEIIARGEKVELKELRFVKQKGTHGGPYMTPSGWTIDPKQVSEIVKLPRKKR